MRITLQPFTDEEYPGTFVEAGLVEQLGQKKRVIHIAANQGDKTFFTFFGFRTQNRSGIIANMSVITYDADALYRSKFSSAAASAARTEMTRDYFDSKTAVLNIFENKAMGKLPTPYNYADIKGVYRPEDLAADQAEIRRIINEIEKQKEADELAQVAAKAANDAEATVDCDENEEDCTAGSLGKIDRATAERLNSVYELHRNEEEEANTGAIVAVIIGAILLFGILAVCCWKMCNAKKQMAGGTRGGGRARGDRIVVTGSVNTRGGS